MAYRNFTISLMLLFLFQTGLNNGASYNFHYPDEYYEFTLYYGIFRVGKAELRRSYNELDSSYFFYVRAETTGIAKLFRYIDYSFEALMSANNELPLRANRYIHEKSYHSSNMVIFDHHSRIDSAIIYSQETGTHVVQKGMLDILTAFNHYRHNILSEDMDQAGYESIIVYFWDDVYDFRLRYSGKEEIKFREDKVECLKCCSATEVGRFFPTDEDLHVWFTNDPLRLPVLVIANLSFGTIRARLSDYTVVTDIY